MPPASPAMTPSDTPVTEVLDRATGPRKPEVDELLELFSDLTGEAPVVWAGRIIGFGDIAYRYASGHGGRMPLLAFAPGAARHTIYLVSDFAEKWPELLSRLGRHRASTSCLHVTRLSALDRDVLRELLERSLAETRAAAA